MKVEVLGGLPVTGHRPETQVKLGPLIRDHQVLASMCCALPHEDPEARGAVLVAHRVPPDWEVHPCYCCT